MLPYEEFEALQELLADAGDLVDLRAAKSAEAGEPGVLLSGVRKQLADCES